MEKEATTKNMNSPAGKGTMSNPAPKQNRKHETHLRGREREEDCHEKETLPLLLLQEKGRLLHRRLSEAAQERRKPAGEVVVSYAQGGIV